MVNIRTILLFSCTYLIFSQTILSSIDSTSVSDGVPFPPKMIGLSSQIDQMIPLYTDSYFLNLYLNSAVYGVMQNAFSHFVHVKQGYAYNCNYLSSLGKNITCTQDLSNQTIWKIIGDFAYKMAQNTYAVGWDYQNYNLANFTNVNYMNNFVQMYNTFFNNAGQYENIELSYKADIALAKYNYNPKNLINDCKLVRKNINNNYNYGPGFHQVFGPGVTQSANSSWYQSMVDIGDKCTAFSITGVVFKNVSQLTIPNLLSQKYTSQYIKNRFVVQDIDYFPNLATVRTFISQLKLVNDPNGLAGLTNSFAAGLWALDFIMEWALAGGDKIAFYSPYNNSDMTIMGGAPNYGMSNLFTALVFAQIATSQTPIIYRPQLTVGSSMSIKSYYIKYSVNVGFLLINKDTNTNSSGYVRVKLPSPYTKGIQCIEFSADGLSSTTSTIAGLRFQAGSFDPIGNFTPVSYKIQSDGYYKVSLKYSQAISCRTPPAASRINAPVAPPGYVWDGWLRLQLIFYILACFLIYI